MTRNDFKKLTRIRLREAHALLKLRHYCGAYYLAGYAVESALKACIAKQTRQYEFPDKQRAIGAFEHLPLKLTRAADLADELEKEKKRDPLFGQYWETVLNWTVEKRYETSGTASDVIALLKAIEEPNHGVLQWLRNHW